MSTLYFAIPGDIETPTGGYGYDRRVAAGLRDLGWTVEIVPLPEGFPDPDADALEMTAARFAAIPNGALVLVDGLAFARIPGIARRHERRLRLAALVHHPLADEGGLGEARSETYERDERAALGAARLVVCTSRTTRRRLADRYGVPQDRLLVAPPGTERQGAVAEDRTSNLVLCVASIVPRKGHDVLIDALALLRDIAWTARFVGPARDEAWLAELRGRAGRAGIADRIAFAGAVSDPSGEYARAGIFALATRHEGYGMAYAEALAAGLPVVGCAVGAVPEVVPQGAGELVPPDDAKTFAAALRRLLADRDVYARAAADARAAAETLPRWEETARLLSDRLKGIG